MRAARDINAIVRNAINLCEYHPIKNLMLLTELLI